MKFIFTITFSFILGSSHSQDYSIIPDNLNAQGPPNVLFLAKARIVNNSSSAINMFMERIIKDIPANWSSCFCHPQCVAPFVDTISFAIPANSEDSIMPNFFADSIPGLGTIQVRLYQLGFQSLPDTITFTGSTMSSTSVPYLSLPAGISVYPNPCLNHVSVDITEDGECSASLYDLSGKLACSSGILKSKGNILPLDGLKAGIYFLKITFTNGTIISNKIIKTSL